MTIEELIERLQKAEGANFALDNAIGELFEPERTERGVNHRCYTGSIDAAVMLVTKVLPGFGYEVEHLPCYGPKSHATIFNEVAVSVGVGRGATQAIALVRATLNAVLRANKAKDSRP